MKRRAAIVAGIAGLLAVVGLAIVVSAPGDAPAALPAPEPRAPDPRVERAAQPEPAPRVEAEADAAAAPAALLPAPQERAPDVAIAGPTRVVRGFVLDLAGDPVASVRVELVPMARDARALATTTDRGGAFSFVAPVTDVRVAAEGGDLGRDRAWVGAGDTERVVDLVLEPVGFVTVLVGDASPRRRVSIRTRDPKALGPDRSWDPGPGEVDVDALENEDEDEHGHEDEHEDEDAHESERWAALGRRTEVVAGRVGEPLAVPADVRYEAVLIGDGPERSCAAFTLGAGEELTLRCEVPPTNATLTGRVRARDGAPVEAELELLVGGRHDHATHAARTGPDGRFRAHVTLTDPALVEVQVRDAAAGASVLVRRNVTLSPGQERDLGDLLLLTGEAVPDPWPDGAYGGIGGLVAFGDDGVTVLDMETDSPLYLEGVERDDTIVLVDGLPLGELPDDEALVRLRGDPGTHVELRLRSARGELYDLVLERKLMGAPSETWGDGGWR